jgi:hypothetical protein
LELTAPNSIPNTPLSFGRTGSNTDTTPNFTADISDPDTAQQIKGRFQIYQDDGVTLISTIDSAFRTGAGTVTAEYTSALAIGVYRLRVAAVDDAGAISPYTAFIQFQVTQLVSEDTTLIWDVKQNTSKDLSLLWDIAANNIKEVALLWNVLVRSENKDFSLQWRIENPWILVPLDDDSPSTVWTEV